MMRIFLTIALSGFLAASVAAVPSGPVYCGDEGTAFPPGDLSGPDGEPDCYVDLHDFAVLAANWLRCSDPTNPACEDLHLPAYRNVNAIQTPYQAGVPHTNKTGALRTNYGAAESFFPIIMWGAAPSTAGDGNWSNLAAAGFNTVAPGFFSTPANFLTQGQAAGLQVIVRDTNGTYLSFGNVGGHPNLLAIKWWPYRDPTEFYFTGDIVQRYDAYLAFRATANSIAPGTPVFVSDGKLITHPTRDWWLTWNTSGEITCHKNFAVQPVTSSLGHDPDGIPQTCSLAVAANDAAKPFWFVAGVSEAVGPDDRGFRFPTEMQLRASVYAALAHGATGIGYSTWDNSAARGSGVIGIAANPLSGYVQGQPVATPMQLAQSRGLWHAVKQLNAELAALAPALLSPTADSPYSLSIQKEGVTHTPIRTILKEDPAGGYVLITVNLDKAIFRVTYAFEQALATVQPRFENVGPLALDAGAQAFDTYYEAYDVRVFHLDFVP